MSRIQQSKKAAAADSDRTRREEGFEERAPRSETVDASRAETLSEEELLAYVQSEFTQESLPQVQPPPGWHYCWLAINSSYDPIHKRMRLGYQPVTFAELAESGQALRFETYKAPSGDFAGCVQCNEMVLFKLPISRYLLIMREFHHNMPLREEEGIRANATPDKRDSNGKPLVKIDEEDEGIRELGRAPERAVAFT